MKLFFTLFFACSFFINLCSFAEDCIDSDGDGWGWDGEKSCRMVTSEASTSNSGVLNPPCLDKDGDGWGWNGKKSCRVDPNATSSTSTPSDCVDSDGDGWGWDGEKSCIMNVEDSESVLPNEQIISGIEFDFPNTAYLNTGATLHQGELLFFMNHGKLFEPELPSHVTSSNPLLQFQHSFFTKEGKAKTLPIPENLPTRIFVPGTVGYRTGTQVIWGDTKGNLQLADRAYHFGKVPSGSNYRLRSSYEYIVLLSGTSVLETSTRHCQGLASIYGCIKNGKNSLDDILKRGSYNLRADGLDSIISLGSSFPVDEISFDPKKLKDPRAAYSVLRAECVGKDKIFAVFKNWDTTDFSRRQNEDKTAYAFLNKDLSGDINIVHEVTDEKSSQIFCNHGLDGELRVHVSTSFFNSSSKKNIFLEKPNSKGKNIIPTPEIDRVVFSGVNSPSVIAGVGLNFEGSSVGKITIFLWETGEIVSIPKELQEGHLMIHLDPATNQVCYSTAEMDLYSSMRGNNETPKGIIACEPSKQFLGRAGRTDIQPKYVVKERRTIKLDFKEPDYHFPQ